MEKRSLLTDDRLVWLELSVSTIPNDGGPGPHGIVQVQDVTERKRFEEQLRYIADHDSLTGLMNRRRFREELDSQLALRRRYGGVGALLLIDMDRLKAVNDTRGHGAGDVALRRVAEAMRGRFRSTDVLARLAGDEFAVLLPNAESHEAMALADALIARIATDEVASWGVSVSVGVAPFGGDDTRTTEDVMATADAAMYRAKQRGGGVAVPAETPPAGFPHSRTEEARGRSRPARSLVADLDAAPQLVREPSLIGSRPGGARRRRAPHLRPAGHRPAQRPGRPPRAAGPHARRVREGALGLVLPRCRRADAGDVRGDRQLGRRPTHSRCSRTDRAALASR